MSDPRAGWRRMCRNSSSLRRPGLGQDVVWHADLAYVVEQGGDTHGFEVPPRHAHGLGDAHGVVGDLLAVPPGVRVLGLHRPDQGRNALQRGLSGLAAQGHRLGRPVVQHRTAILGARGTLDHRQQFTGVEGLFDIVVCPQQQGLGDELPPGIARDEYHLAFGHVTLGVGQQLQPAQVRHAHVGDQHIKRPRGGIQQVSCPPGVGGYPTVKTLLDQFLLDQLAQGRLVIHYQHMPHGWFHWIVPLLLHSTKFCRLSPFRRLPSEIPQGSGSSCRSGAGSSGPTARMA